MNNPVSFELAKLLKGKGFDENTRFGFNGAYEPYHLNIIEFGYLQRNSELLDAVYSAPTIAEVVCWFYEKHNIWIAVSFANKNMWFFNISRVGFSGKDKSIFVSNYDYFSPTEAYEAAIKYVLEKINL